MNVLYDDGTTKRTFHKKPELSDFYKPSEKMKHYQNLTMGITGLGSGMLLGLLI